MRRQRKRPKICLVSSSGGHYEQLRMLSELKNSADIFFVTEKTEYNSQGSKYYLVQTGLRDKLFPLKMIANSFLSLFIWLKERPDYVITTGTMVAIPMALLSKIAGRKLIFIETFARVYDGTKTGKLMYKYADLFIVQWENLLKIYPKAIYGGSIY